MLWFKFRKTTRVGSFKPKLTPVAIEQFKALYTLLLQGQSVDMASIAPIAHRILFFTFTTPMDTRHPVDSAFEQSLIFSMVTSNAEQWLSADCLTHLCAQVQRTIFSTFFHTAWMGGIDGAFTLSHPTDNITTQEEKAAADEDIDTVTDVEAEEDLEDREDEIDFENFDGVKADFNGWAAAAFDITGDPTVDVNHLDLEVQDTGMEILHGREVCEDQLLK
jgi:hypothetical protein